MIMNAVLGNNYTFRAKLQSSRLASEVIFAKTTMNFSPGKHVYIGAALCPGLSHIQSFLKTTPDTVS